MIVGLGIDICSVSRMTKALEHPRFALRIFTEGERVRIDARGANTAAGIFAAKEAAAKALGTGFNGFGFLNVEVLWNADGGPYCALSGGAKDRFDALGGGRLVLSITHDAGTAAAVVVWES